MRLGNARRRVLVVDDDLLIREVMQELLEFEGCEVCSADDGAAALEELRSGRQLPCVIFLDIMMPRTSGLSFLDARALDPALRAIPVVVTTAAARIPAIEGIEWLIKPLRADDLIAALDRHCPRDA